MIKVQYRRVTTPNFEVNGKPTIRIALANGYNDIRLHCVGDDGLEIASFKVPSNPKALQELATAIEEAAAEIEGWRKATAQARGIAN